MLPRGPETTGNRVVAGPDTYSYQYPNACHEDGRIELKLRCPTLTSFRLEILERAQAQLSHPHLLQVIDPRESSSSDVPPPPPSG